MRENNPLARTMNAKAELANEGSEILSGLLEKCYFQWQCGDWGNLSQLKEGQLRAHPDRVEIAILVAVALISVGDIDKAKKFIDISMKWGGRKKLIPNLLVTSSYISLSRAANFAGDEKGSLDYLEKSIHAFDEYCSEARRVISAEKQAINGNIIFSKKIDNIEIKNELLLGKRILIVLWFRNLSGGGLHENVRDTAKTILESAGEPVVICPTSSFAEELIALGIRVIQVDFDIVGFEEAIRDCIENYDLVHCHPGPSRKVGIKLAEMANCPLVMTIHGAWDDGISGYAEKIDAIFVVSEFIKDNLLNKMPHARSKIFLIPNGVDFSEFTINNKHEESEFFASFVGRIDVDKKDGINLLKTIWAKQAAKELPLFKWAIAGDGPLLDDLKEYGKNTFQNDEHIEYLGWLNRKALAKLLYETDFAIAAGRSGSEALVSGCSTVLSGKEGFMLVKNWKNFTDAAYCNFGGFGSQYSECSLEEIVDFLNGSYSSFERGSTSIKDIISQYMRKYYNKEYIGEKIVYQYAGLIIGK